MSARAGRQFWALTKLSLKAIFLSAAGGLGQHNRKKAASALGIVLVLAACALYISGFYSLVLLDVLAPIGMEVLLFVFMGLVALIGGVLITVFSVQDTVFGGRDNDLLLSMPVPTSVLMASRVVAIYVKNLFFTALILVPAGGLYAWLSDSGAGATLLFWLRLTLVVFLLPLLGATLSVALGALVAWLSAKIARGRALWQNLVTGVYFVAMIWFGLSINDRIGALATEAQAVLDAMTWATPLIWLAEGLLGNLGALLLFMACCVGAFALLVIVFGRLYRQAVTALAVRATRSDYQLQALSSSGQKRALLKKELRRLVSSPTYFWNAGTGLILLVVAAVAALWNQTFLQETLAELGGGDLTGLLLGLMVVGFCVSSCPLAAPAFSLEGRCLWILREAPVATKTLVWTKAGFELSLTLPVTMLVSLCLALALDLSVIYCIILALVSVIYCILHATFGVLIGLIYPKLDATSDAAVIKQSLASLLGIFVPLVILYVALGGAWALNACLANELLAGVALLVGLGVVAAVCAGLLSRQGPRLLGTL